MDNKSKHSTIEVVFSVVYVSCFVCTLVHLPIYIIIEKVIWWISTKFSKFVDTVIGNRKFKFGGDPEHSLGPGLIRDYLSLHSSSNGGVGPWWRCGLPECSCFIFDIVSPISVAFSFFSHDPYKFTKKTAFFNTLYWLRRVQTSLAELLQSLIILVEHDTLKQVRGVGDSVFLYYSITVWVKCVHCKSILGAAGSPVWTQNCHIDILEANLKINLS